MKTLQFPEYASLALERLAKGAFLTTKHNGQVNTMTISWGNLGIMWNKPVCTVMVRPSRHTYGMIEGAGEYTLSIPLTDELAQALALCGSKSGRDMDKFAAANLTAVAGQKTATPVIQGACLHLECKTLYKQPMDGMALEENLRQLKYATGDFHTFYAGEILAAYKTE